MNIFFILILFFVDDFQCLQNGFVGGVDDGIESVFFIYISTNQSFKPKFELFLTIGVQSEHLVAFLLVKLHELADGCVGNRHFGYKIFGDRVLPQDFVFVFIGVVEGKFNQRTRVVYLVESHCIAVTVEGHEEVGHDAAAAIDGAAFLGFVLKVLIELDTVGEVHFPAFVAAQEVGVVVAVAFVVIPLDASSAGRVVAGHGESDGGTVGKDKLLLDKPFPERATSYLTNKSEEWKVESEGVAARR